MVMGVDVAVGVDGRHDGECECLHQVGDLGRRLVGRSDQQRVEEIQRRRGSHPLRNVQLRSMSLIDEDR